MSFELKESGVHDYCKKLVANALSHRVANRRCAWMEYPVISSRLTDEIFGNGTFDSWASNGRELPKNHVPQLDGTEFVPTYEYCKDNGCIPIAIVDVACARKGSVSEIWEITNTNPLTKEKVRKLFNVLGDDVDIYEIHVKDIMNGLNIHDPNLYNLLVKKAKKWTPEDTIQSKCEQWVENVLANHKKYGYSIDVDACKELFQNMCNNDFTNENDEKKILMDVYRYREMGAMSALVKKDYALCFMCGDLYNVKLNEEYKSNQCDKCLEKEEGYQEYIKKFREVYKKWGYDVKDTSHYFTYLHKHPPSSTAKYGDAICFGCGIPDRGIFNVNNLLCKKCLIK